jgi:hypothetical protein
MAVSKKATPTKKSVKKTTHKKAAAQKAKRRPILSFRIDSETTPFLTFRLTRQSLYWLVFSTAVLGLGIWVLFLNIKIIQIYDQIQLNDAVTDSLMEPQAKKVAL